VVIVAVVLVGAGGSVVVEQWPITASTIVSRPAAFVLYNNSSANQHDLKEEGVLRLAAASQNRGFLSSRGLDVVYAASLEGDSILSVGGAGPASAKPTDKWQMREYIVQSGDTLSEIADRFEVSTDSVALSNGLDKNPDRLKVGQKLQIPPTSGIVYTVSAGDTISDLSSRYEVAVADIADVNKLADPYPLQPGQVIFIPGAKMAAPQLGVALGDYLWPTTGIITTYFGESGHKGLDLANRTGTPIYASDGGTVTTAVKLANSYGWHVIIDHGNGISTLYGHLSRIDVDPGERVRRGQVIGLMGNTGYSTGPHLHFEVRRTGVYQNPLNFLP
jgi:murein DD-endopeptidase MepM/ murein hydrolase activator NlpD